MNDPLVLLGEVCTGLLPAASALSYVEAAELLTLLPGESAETHWRPISLVISPDTLAGVDCQLATMSGSASRVVGTVAARGTLVGGRVAQGSARVRVFRAADGRRKPWRHYLNHPGTVELLNKVKDDGRSVPDIADGFLTASTADTLALGPIADRLLTRLRIDPRWSGWSPIRAPSTRLRWAARVAAPESGPTLTFGLADETLRLVRVTVPTVADLTAVQRFCEDLAAHDWLLTTLASALDAAEVAESPDRVITLLAPVLERLGHLWMPDAHTPPPLRELWRGLDAEAGFSRQWEARLEQLRNRLFVSGIERAAAIPRELDTIARCAADEHKRKSWRFPRFS
ncbi:SCO2521 family protein [Nocardia sp. NPDC052001]|uniref:SCO2521 family protein n=1 Tax=Nocardia sp. NPDC052001 TaxID=3154853 RepID=UPI003446DB37